MLAVAVERGPRRASPRAASRSAAALFGADGTLLGRGHNRRVQDDDPSMHGETAAFRNAGRQRIVPRHDDGDDAVAVLVLLRPGPPVRHLAGSSIGEARTFYGGHDWLAENGVEVVLLDDPECVAMMTRLHRRQPALWNEDIGEP